MQALKDTGIRKRKTWEAVGSSQFGPNPNQDAAQCISSLLTTPAFSKFKDTLDKFTAVRPAV
jgi:hypothetical protein